MVSSLKRLTLPPGGQFKATKVGARACQTGLAVSVQRGLVGQVAW